MPTLFIFAGLPGSGKTSLSQRLSKRIKGVHIRIDTIEQGLRELCGVKVEGEGYRMAYRIASDNLRLGLDVVADSCNPLELTRREWEHVANDCSARIVNIEVICSNSDEHRHRVESRRCDIPELKLPTWHDIQNCEYHNWSTDRIVVDTAGCTPDASLENLMAVIGGINTTP